jgi:hypothetical protein
MLGHYQNFPLNVHRIDVFKTTIASKQLQQRLIQAFFDANREEFSFEQVANPTVPDGRVIFEFGLADGESFNFIDEEEVAKARGLLAQERLASTDFFCSIRYYKVKAGKKTALKFDYYMLRAIFGKDTFEVQIYHERGPRYISPEDLAAFIANRVNAASNRKVIKKQT